MAKKNIVIMLVMTVLLISGLLLADTINFNESKDVAHNLQGKIIHRTYTDNYSNYVDVPVTNQEIVVTTKNSSGNIIGSYILTTDSNGNYYIDFPTENLSQISLITVHFHGKCYSSDFDVNVDSSIRIDIVWGQDF